MKTDSIKDKQLIRESDKYFGIMVLSRGKLEDNSDYWAYVLMPPSKFKAFQKVKDVGNFVLTDYGRIIECGEGKTPPEAVREQMKKDYNFSESFERDIIAQASSIGAKAAAEQKE